MKTPGVVHLKQDRQYDNGRPAKYYIHSIEHLPEIVYGIKIRVDEIVLSALT